MMTSGSFLNVENSFSHIFQSDKNHFPSAKNSNKNMSYHFISNRSSPPEYKNSSFEDEIENEDRHYDRFHLDPTEKKKIKLNDGVNKSEIHSSLLPFHPAARGGFSLDSFGFNLSRQNAVQQEMLSNISMSSQSFNSTVCKSTASSKKKQLESNGLSNQQRAFDDDDDDASWKICGVCNDKATGYHFNALTCEGCKGFFRRSIKNSKTFTCSYNNQCSITKSNRRQCQSCRLQKCIDIGMKRECIMSQDQIQIKKSLVLSNRIKRATQVWVPMELQEEQRVLLNTICLSFVQSNVAPSQENLRGADAIKKDSTNRMTPCSSPCSSNSSGNFNDLIKRISSEIVARTPSNMTGGNTGNNAANAAHVYHFTDIMEFSIKEVIKFCKKIPTFMDLNLTDQIALLKAGCTEILFIKANYTYDVEKKALTLGPDILYTRESFLQGGMSEEYADTYLRFHEDLSRLNLNDMEMASLSSIALFSADRADVKEYQKVEFQQQCIAEALQAYTESTYRIRHRFAHITSFLPRLRTLNALCTTAFTKVQKDYGEDIRPLVIEVQPTDENET